MTGTPSRSDTPAPQGKRVPCPTCGGPSLYSPANRFRPFCCERCKQIDLGAWAAEDFRMPAEAPPEDAEFGDPKRQP
ncbi:DNA gyrase inhibitor YacG [Diaphorobacter nitroreducens]|uniref:DNA gyrase inhibitor YacG n=1 Tax=Diaphorobacter nitroreducens TaxID=164759 RepID=UPI0028986D9E|nr:DNA gyrase inhibitor YacG [Diaphorobacter nitroreducens]